MYKIVPADHLIKTEKLKPPTNGEVRAALDILIRHNELADDKEPTSIDIKLANLLHPTAKELDRNYSKQFEPNAEYRESMPDLQNGPESLIKGAKREIQHVGISNFRLPLNYKTRDNVSLTIETSVTGTVSLAATKKGINMSRIMRSFYKYSSETFDFDRIDQVLQSYLGDLETFDARLQLKFRFPILKRSLRSNLEGYQYYDVAFEVVRHGTQDTRIIHMDYVYSSTCPCSLELSEHARNIRGKMATPHSQRSVARVSAVLDKKQNFFIEDLVDLCVEAIQTETQVMVKREDEQAFAELNGSNPIFVEDAVRLIYKSLEGDKRINDFRVVASHQESLHSHDAVSILTSGPTFAQTSYDPQLFRTLYHVC
jgi:GTP cyclohydrolase I